MTHGRKPGTFEVIPGNPAPEAQARGAPQRPARDREAAGIVLEVVARGSFRAASEHLGLSVDAVRRRVDEFECALGVKLMTRHPDGVKTTPEGEKVLAVLQMDMAPFGLLRAKQALFDAPRDVCIAAEDVLYFWLMPGTTAFSQANPHIVLDMNCLASAADVLGFGADVGIQTVRPEQRDLRIVKLGGLHFMLFATHMYLTEVGVPKATRDLEKHRIFIGPRGPAGLKSLDVAFVTMSTCNDQYRAVASGAGIGLLPTFVRSLDPTLVPLDVGIHESAEVWLTFHRDARRTPGISRVIDWLIGQFSATKFPWFRDQFVPTMEFVTAHHEAVIGQFIGHAGAHAGAISSSADAEDNGPVGRVISPERALAILRGSKGL